jgi:hypothetical protein
VSSLSGIIYIFGGQTRRGLNLSTWGEFDTRTNSWIPTPTYAAAVTTPRFVSLASNPPATTSHGSCDYENRRTFEQSEIENNRLLELQIKGSVGFVFGQSLFVPPFEFNW